MLELLVTTRYILPSRKLVDMELLVSTKNLTGKIDGLEAQSQQK